MQIHTGLDQVYGVACVGIKDIPAATINAFMWDKYRIITTPINRPEYNGIRVTPNIYTPLEEIDTFVDGDGGLAEERPAGADRVIGS